MERYEKQIMHKTTESWGIVDSSSPLTSRLRRPFLPSLGVPDWELKKIGLYECRGLCSHG